MAPATRLPAPGRRRQVAAAPSRRATPPRRSKSSTDASAASPGEPLQAPSPALLARKRSVTDGNPRGRLLDALWLHRSRAGRIRRPLAAAGDRNAIDIGEIAVIQDEGDLIEPANPYDLRAIGLRFTRNGAGGYDAARIDGAFRTTVGSRLTLTDDDSVQLNLPFAFSFYGRSQTIAFVNSDGNLTFEERRQRQHRTQRRPHAHRAAARRPVPGRPRSVDRRPRPGERRRRRLHRDLVRRPRLRVGADDERPADAVCRAARSR